MSEYYNDPNVIAEALCKLAYDEPDQSVIDDLDNALYDIKIWSENKFNRDYWRTFYKVLAEITSRNED